MDPTHYDIAVIVAVSFAIQIAGLVTIIVVGWHALRDLSAMLAESQRLTKAVGALVIQEADKTRTALRQQ
ncbi:MAG: hypothetical protein HYS37_08705 [Candidatus Rokubacteria bacterium]|nr:hypothetical protein [Candidatus Rokubacteria bacterium]